MTARSANGWTANDRSVISTRTVRGTAVRMAVRTGPAGDLLLEVAALFDLMVQDLDQPLADDWGYAERPIRGTTDVISNHASGTAIDLNAPKHPLGRRDTFSRGQENAIRVILRELDGTVRWGGDYQNRADEMHFEINASAAKVKQVADRLRGAAARKPALGTYVVKPGGVNVRRLPRRGAAITRTLAAGESRRIVARRYRDDLWWGRTVAGSWLPFKDLKKKG